METENRARCGLCGSTNLHAGYADIGFGISRVTEWGCIDCGAIQNEGEWERDDKDKGKRARDILAK